MVIFCRKYGPRNKSVIPKFTGSLKNHPEFPELLTISPISLRVKIQSFYLKIGGLGEAVLSAVALEKNIIVKKLAVPRIPRSGPPDVLLDMFGINHRAIVGAVQEILKA